MSVVVFNNPAGVIDILNGLSIGEYMSLPRYLRNKYINGNYDAFIMTYWGAAKIQDLMSYFHPDYKNESIASTSFSIIQELIPCNKRSYPLHVLKESTIKHGFRKRYIIAPCLLRHFQDSNNVYKKVEIKYFTGWVKEDGAWKWTYKPLLVNSYFYESAEAASYKRRDHEKKLIDTKDDLERIMKIEQGRFFSGRLRFMILERDNFRCVFCGRSADEVSLEVDHKVAWVDGGKTTYENGQTVCTDCNKGKHLIKSYKEKLDAFNTIK